ncbi:translation initiation factor IF-2-like [Panthera leo]|uniref:translation initiation factor IF-2-like n=1 Tax=Panthera leo TaxID=9689 RepID=UPI001C6A3173|nr:translation initiation factor IF-2-like [Panthera leo]
MELTKATGSLEVTEQTKTQTMGKGTITGAQVEIRNNKNRSHVKLTLVIIGEVEDAELKTTEQISEAKESVLASLMNYFAVDHPEPPQASPQGVPPAAAPPPLPGRSPDPAPTSPQGVAAAAGSREEALRGWREAPGDAARLGPAAARGNSKGSRPHSLCRTGARIGAAAPAPHYLLRAAAAGGRRDRSGPCSPGSGDEEAATTAAAKDNQEPAGSAPPRRAQNARAQGEPGPHLQPGCDGGRRLGLEDGLDSRAPSLVGKRKQSRGLIGESSVAPLPLPSIIGSSAPYPLGSQVAAECVVLQTCNVSEAKKPGYPGFFARVTKEVDIHSPSQSIRHRSRRSRRKTLDQRLGGTQHCFLGRKLPHRPYPNPTSAAFVRSCFE